MAEVVQILMNKERLQPLADSIKTLKGSNEDITLVGMEDTVENANASIENQANLITQISNALESKAAGGGASIDTCSVTINGGYIIGAAVLDNGVITIVKYTPGDITTLDNVVSGTIVYVYGGYASTYTLENCSHVYEPTVGRQSYEAIAIDTGVTSASITVTSDSPPEPV